jgi:hypothetical protein
MAIWLQNGEPVIGPVLIRNQFLGERFLFFFPIHHFVQFWKDQPVAMASSALSNRFLLIA